MSGHLSDRIIQEFLESDGQQHRQDVFEHTRQCEACSRHLDSYKELFNQLATPPHIFIPENFASVIAQSVEARQETLKGDIISDKVMLTGFTLIGFGVAAFFIDWPSTFNIIKNISITTSSLNVSQDSILNNMIQCFKPGLALLPVAGIALGLIAWLDNKIQHRTKIN
ncbi:hypothetical protein KAR48_10255 [bacterium]|nr:hypothetical protein [bacterium]